MNVRFDVPIDWQIVAADLDNDTHGRRYYAAPPPYLAVLVMHGQAAHDLDYQAFNLYGCVADCSIGWHEADAPLGYTLPEHMGLKHSKLTVRRIIESPHELLFSEFLANCPTASAQYPTRGGEAFILRLPIPLIKALQDIAKEQKISIDTLAWRVLLDYTISHR